MASNRKIKANQEQELCRVKQQLGFQPSFPGTTKTASSLTSSGSFKFHQDRDHFRTQSNLWNTSLWLQQSQDSLNTILGYHFVTFKNEFWRTHPTTTTWTVSLLPFTAVMTPPVLVQLLCELAEKHFWFCFGRLNFNQISFLYLNHYGVLLIAGTRRRVRLLLFFSLFQMAVSILIYNVWCSPNSGLLREGVFTLLPTPSCVPAWICIQPFSTPTVCLSTRKKILLWIRVALAPPFFWSSHI